MLKQVLLEEIVGKTVKMVADPYEDSIFIIFTDDTFFSVRAAVDIDDDDEACGIIEKNTFEVHRWEPDDEWNPFITIGIVSREEANLAREKLLAKEAAAMEARNRALYEQLKARFEGEKKNG